MNNDGGNGNNNNNTNPRILIVDDDYDITLTFKIGLEEDSGFVVDTFNDTLLALSNFKAGIYNLLLIDIKTPKINGFELCRQMKKIDSKVKVCFYDSVRYTKRRVIIYT
jgi:DNA-binding response OmpR family regulator